MTALEYGCGTGLVSFALQPQLGHITLADSSTGMLAVLREKIAAGNIQNMTPVQLDLITDPLPAERYQLIYTLLTLHHIPDTDKILRAFYQLLDSSGYLCVADLDKEDGTFHEDEFHGHLGFDREELSAQGQTDRISEHPLHDGVSHDQGRPRRKQRFPHLSDGGSEITRGSETTRSTGPGNNGGSEILTHRPEPLYFALRREARLE